MWFINFVKSLTVLSTAIIAKLPVEANAIVNGELLAATPASRTPLPTQGDHSQTYHPLVIPLTQKKNKETTRPSEHIQHAYKQQCNICPYLVPSTEKKRVPQELPFWGVVFVSVLGRSFVATSGHTWDPGCRCRD